MAVDYLSKTGAGSGVLASGRQRMKPTRSQSSGSFENHNDTYTGPGGFSSSLPSSQQVSNASPSKTNARLHKSPASTHSARFDMGTIGYYPESLDKKTRPKHKVHILPHLKKDRRASIDLNLSAVENEGLGIYTNLDRDERYGDAYVTAARLAGPTAHHRSISGNSQYSASMGLISPTKPGADYVHPMRQVPRPRTPINRSNQNSLTGSASETQQFPDLDDNSLSNSREQIHQTSSIHSNMETQNPITTARDTFIFPQTPSQTNVARTSSTFSRPYENSSVRETLSPISRSSLDFAFRSRGRSSTTDPVARAAAVEAARQAFEDREAAKSRKHEQRAMKAQDKELRRQEQIDQNHASGRAPRLAGITLRNHGGHNEKTSPRGSFNRSQSDNQTANTGCREESEKGFKIKSPKSAWLLFLTWLRTRIFKLGKRLKKK